MEVVTKSDATLYRGLGGLGLEKDLLWGNSSHNILRSIIRNDEYLFS